MLDKKEIKQLVSLLKKIENPHEGLPQPVFDALVKLVPFAACELIIANNKKEILLAWRDDKYWKGWHFPGGLLRFGESFDERIQKTAWNELGINIEKSKFLFPVNYVGSARGHGVSLIFLCFTQMIPKDGKFFKKMPRNIISEHRELWEKLSKKINKI